MADTFLPHTYVRAHIIMHDNFLNVSTDIPGSTLGENAPQLSAFDMRVQIAAALRIQYRVSHKDSQEVDWKDGGTEA